MPQPERLACLIASRNLGDIVICSGLLRELAAAGYAERYLVWTRPKIGCLFEGIPDCDIVCSPFPVGTGYRFGLPELGSMLKAAAEIRSRRPSVVIDFVGDFRERLFGRLIGGRHLQIGWAREHGHSRLIRNPFGAARAFVTVPSDVPNVYGGYELMIDALIPRSRRDSRARKEFLSRRIRRIGLHPFASQPSKLWPDACWRELVHALAAKGLEIWVFSSPEERLKLERLFAGLADRVVLCSTEIEQYALQVSQLDLLIGLDSFSVHMAHRCGVRSITINSGAPPELFAVPSGRTLAASGGCQHYPCFHRAPCRGTHYENACVKSISPQQVLAALEALQRDDESAKSSALAGEV